MDCCRKYWMGLTRLARDYALASGALSRSYWDIPCRRPSFLNDKNRSKKDMPFRRTYFSLFATAAEK